MLKITIQETPESIEMKLEGRVAGPWVSELNQAWAETAPRIGAKKLSLDLANVTYSDGAGMEALKNIYARTQAQLITGTLWTQYLAEEISKSATERVD